MKKLITGMLVVAFLAVGASVFAQGKAKFHIGVATETVS